MVRLMQRLSRLEEEEKNRLETRKRRFFAEILNAVREFQLQVQAALKRRKQRNDGVQASYTSVVCGYPSYIYYNGTIEMGEEIGTK